MVAVHLCNGPILLVSLLHNRFPLAIPAHIGRAEHLHCVSTVHENAVQQHRPTVPTSRRERQSLFNSHRQSRWINYESATTGRAGGLRKAPKRGRGGHFKWQTTNQLLVCKARASRLNGCRPLVQRPATGGFATPPGLPLAILTDICGKGRFHCISTVHRNRVQQYRPTAPSSRWERQSLFNSHQQSWWISYDLTSG
jgi:hypothetical protein